MVRLGQDRESRRDAGGIIEQSVAIAIGQAGGLEQLARFGAIVFARRPHVGIPRAIGRRNRAVNRHRLAEVHGVDNRLTIDRARDRLTKCLMSKPRVPRVVGVNLRQVEPQQVRIQPDTVVDQADAALIRDALERGVILRADVGIGHQVDFAGLQPERFRGLARHHHRQLVQVRQRTPAASFLQ